jgi:hypothetical protein
LGGGGNNTFVFGRGEANGDFIAVSPAMARPPATSFSSWATERRRKVRLTMVDVTHWSMNSADGFTHDIITVQNGAAIHASDCFFC